MRACAGISFRSLELPRPYHFAITPHADSNSSCLTSPETRTRTRTSFCRKIFLAPVPTSLACHPKMLTSPTLAPTDRVGNCERGTKNERARATRAPGKTGTPKRGLPAKVSGVLSLGRTKRCNQRNVVEMRRTLENKFRGSNSLGWLSLSLSLSVSLSLCVQPA